MNGAEDMTLMLNLGWSLEEIAKHYDLHVKVAELMIVTHLKAERIRERLLASAQS
jgi:hypothetical protein